MRGTRSCVWVALCNHRHQDHYKITWAQPHLVGSTRLDSVDHVEPFETDLKLPNRTCKRLLQSGEEPPIQLVPKFEQRCDEARGGAALIVALHRGCAVNGEFGDIHSPRQHERRGGGGVGVEHNPPSTSYLSMKEKSWSTILSTRSPRSPSLRRSASNVLRVLVNPLNRRYL